MQQLSNQDIGVIGSPSTNTEITTDLLLEAQEERIVGALVAFDAIQNGASIKSVGQIVGIELKNRWHEDSVFRNLIKRTGEIPPITNRQDTRTANLVVGATFKKGNEGYEPDVLGMVPPTGTRISRVEQPLLDSLLSVYQENVFYLGRAYANDVYYPMWFKHFGSGPKGAGEAYHIGIFGKTGSGKSGLAKMLLLAYARHPEMGILIIDPQGEFSNELRGQRIGEQRLDVDSVVRGVNREIKVYGITDISFDEWDLLAELLSGSPFLRTELSIGTQSIREIAADRGIAGIRAKRMPHDDLSNREALRVFLNSIGDNSERIYATRDNARRLNLRVEEALGERLDGIFDAYWKPNADLFASGNGKRQIFGIVNDLISSDQGRSPRPVIVIDLSERGNQQMWNEDLQCRILSRLLQAITVRSSQTLAHVNGANALVILDEAHRHAPSGRIEQGSQADQLRTVLRRAVRETRKYGLGWMLISQTLGGIDTEILQQLSAVFFGFGLALGDEYRSLREFAGGDQRSMELYQSFRNPQSAPRRDLREFPFMAIGPISPLSFSGKPMFFSAFQDPDEYLHINKLPSQAALLPS